MAPKAQEDGSADLQAVKADDDTAKKVGFSPQGTTTRIMWAALAVFGLSMVGLFICAYFGGSSAVAIMCGWSMLLSPMVALLALCIGLTRFPVGNKLFVDKRKRLVIERAHLPPMVIERGQFVEGWFNPETHEVQLLRRNGNLITAGVFDPTSATALLEKIGVDASKRTMRIRLGAVDFLNAMTWLLGPIVAMMIGEYIGEVMHERGVIAIPVAMVLFILEFYLVRKLFGPAHLVIGVDGIIVQQRFGSKFVSFDQIESITTAHNHVTLELINGKSIRATARHLEQSERSIIEQRVDDALAIREQRLAEPAALAALDRGDRTGNAWREALRGLFDKDPGYRRAKLTPEQIAAVLVDPAAPTDRRIGAALVLAQAGDEKLASKIRVAAESSANQKVRVALGAIADGDLENAAIEEAALAEAANATRTRA